MPNGKKGDSKEKKSTAGKPAMSFTSYVQKKGSQPAMGFTSSVKKKTYSFTSSLAKKKK